MDEATRNTSSKHCSTTVSGSPGGVKPIKTNAYLRNCTCRTNVLLLAEMSFSRGFQGFVKPNLRKRLSCFWHSTRRAWKPLNISCVWIHLLVHRARQLIMGYSPTLGTQIEGKRTHTQQSPGNTLTPISISNVTLCAKHSEWFWKHVYIGVELSGVYRMWGKNVNKVPEIMFFMLCQFESHQG